MADRNDIAQFYISTDEDLKFRLTFTNRSFTGRTLAINIRERGSNELKTTLTQPTQIQVTTKAGSTFTNNEVSAVFQKSSMAAWATGEYEADLLDLTGGQATRIAPVRFTYDYPGRLPVGVVGNQADITMVENQAIVTAVGGVGLQGDKGDQGDKGWSPLLAIVVDGIRRVHRIVDWAGGAGAKPATGSYLGPTGLVAAIGDATDIRGQTGATGPAVADGDKGDITVSSLGTVWTIDGGYVPKTGGTFTGTITVRNNPAYGYVTLTSGDTSSPGYISFFDEAGVRVGYVGYEPTGNKLAMWAENGFTGYYFNSRPIFGANTPWDSGNFNPASYASLTGATYIGDITVRKTGAGNWPYIVIDADPASHAVLRFSSNTQVRWELARNINGNLSVLRYLGANVYQDVPLELLSATGQMSLNLRPTWGGLTPWDSGNFDPSGYLPLDGPNLRVNSFGALVKGDNTFFGLNVDFYSSAYRALVTGHGSIWQQQTNGILSFTKSTAVAAAGSPFTTVNWMTVSLTGQISTLLRPLFAGNTPWDSGNLGNFVGDAGSGGSRGLVPAPAAGDADAGKRLAADGTWKTSAQDLVTSGSITSSTPNAEVTLPSGYKSFKLVLRNHRPVVDGGYLSVQVKKAGAWKTASGDYNWNQKYWSTSSDSRWDSASNGTTNLMILTGFTGFAAATSGETIIEIEPGDATFVTSLMSQTMHATNGAAGNSSTTAPGRAEALRILYSSGNIGNMQYELYGLRG